MQLNTLFKLGRFREIVTVLLKYGFQDLVERLDIPGKRFIEEHIPESSHEMSTWERLRRSLEELGPAFVKFGQIMSLRPDLLPADLIVELSRLQDDVAPLEFARIREAVEESTGTTLETIFLSFEESPLAAASLAQVHEGVLRDNGRAVAVKVQRPDIKDLVAKDMAIIEAVADYLYDRMEAARIYNFPGLVREFKKGLKKELDFSNELRNMRIARQALQDIDWVIIPGTYGRWSNSTMLTMDLLRGEKIADLDGSHGYHAELLARRGLELSIKQILELGFFHGDPHPGNMLIMPGDRLALIDWGIVGHLSLEDRYELVDLLEAVMGKDPRRILDIFLNMAGEMVAEADERRALREICVILDAYLNVPLASIRMGHLLMDIYSLLRNYDLHIPQDMALMLKSMVTTEGSTRLLYPDLNVMTEAEPYVKKLIHERSRPTVIWKRLRHTIYHLLRLQRDLPRRVRRILRKIETGEINIRLRHENLDELRDSIENSANRLTVGVVVSAMIIGSSMIITTGVKPLLFGYPALGIIGYLMSAVIGIWLVISILRSRKY